MRLLLVGALLLAPTPVLAGKWPCNDACSQDPVSGESCFDQGLGCDPVTSLCFPCTMDYHCMPGGTCDNGTCINVNCQAQPDAGQPDVGQPDGSEPDGSEPDANMDGGLGDAADTGADAGLVDDAGNGGSPDAANDAGPNDSGLHPDALTRLPGPRGMGAPKDEMFDEGGCGCSGVSRGQRSEPAALGLFILVVAVLRRRRLR